MCYRAICYVLEFSNAHLHDGIGLDGGDPLAACEDVLRGKTIRVQLVGLIRKAVARRL